MLVFRTGQLGDTLVALPAIHALKARHRGDKLILLTDKHPDKSYVSSWDILGPTGWFEEVIFYEPGPLYWLNLKAVLATISSIRRIRAGVAYILAPERNAWQLFRDRFFFRIVAGVRECHSRGAGGSPTRRRNRPLPHVKPEWRVLREVIPYSESEHFDLKPLIPQSELDSANELMMRLMDNEATRFVALGPGSKMPSKIWPEERYISLLRRLTKAFENTKFIVLGGKEDKTIGDRISAAAGTSIHNLAGSVSVMGSAAILTRCNAYIGNDTGTMHLAAMVGVPCIALFSARDFPDRWRPYGDNHTILRREVDCEGCMLEVCNKENNRCLREISVDDTISAIAPLLSASH
ncbi:MAG: hypothetical protein A3H27_01705 [Acidobacteria bacterium RIFCSPLOWO2_02_FULL_59_13]|nr:MAG: hypothetical protein A3H27_01705 [Acidobacteria bacterium RIFCSPLOWO2_02_FULL_59_13]